MRADFPVLLDACVLANARVSDLYLRLSEEPRLLLPRWTEEIWRETRRTYIDKLDWPKESADRRIAAATSFFPEAMITGYEPLIDKCENDAKDRHVLAAAIFAKVDTIVTFNLKHFKSEALAPWSISAVHPGRYLITLWEHEPAVVQDKIRRMADDTGESFEQMLERLARSVPQFARYVAAVLDIRLSN